MKATRKRKYVQVTLDQQVWERLQQLAFEKDCSLAFLVRTYVMEGLRQEEALRPAEERERRPLSPASRPDDGEEGNEGEYFPD